MGWSVTQLTCWGLGGGEMVHPWWWWGGCYLQWWSLSAVVWWPPSTDSGWGGFHDHHGDLTVIAFVIVAVVGEWQVEGMQLSTKCESIPHSRDHKTVVTYLICCRGHRPVHVTVQMRPTDVDRTQEGERAYHMDMWATQLPENPSKCLRSSDLVCINTEDWKWNLEILVECQRSRMPTWAMGSTMRSMWCVSDGGRAVTGNDSKTKECNLPNQARLVQ